MTTDNKRIATMALVIVLASLIFSFNLWMKSRMIDECRTKFSESYCFANMER